MQIEVGKRYRTRSGGVVQIVNKDDCEEWPIIGEFKTGYRIGDASCFCKNGRWIAEETSDFDLIEELPADATG